VISEGQIVLLKFPQTNQKSGKLRPVLVLRELPGKFDDWLICMISSQLHHLLPKLDEIVKTEDFDFLESGLKVPSVIRVSRLAVVSGEILIGRLGQIEIERLVRIKQNLMKWIMSA